MELSTGEIVIIMAAITAGLILFLMRECPIKQKGTGIEPVVEALRTVRVINRCPQCKKTFRFKKELPVANERTVYWHYLCCDCTKNFYYQKPEPKEEGKV